LRLLIDENLSPRLARWACELGIPAEAAVHVGLAGAKDEAVFAHA
jgi:predicted nuclease of predicted toxin-antitoxin system